MNRTAGAAVGSIVSLVVLGALWALRPVPAANPPPAAIPPIAAAPPPAEPPGPAPSPGAAPAQAAAAVIVAAGAAGAVDWDRLDGEVATVRAQSWQAMDEAGWAAAREDLLADLAWVRARPAAERAAHREDELQLLAQLGRAAENANDAVAPFYAPASGMQVNAAWYEAAALVAAGDRAVLDVLGDNERESIDAYVAWIDQGVLAKQPPTPLAR